MIRAIGVALALAFASSAWAWEDTDNEFRKTSTTRVAEIVMTTTDADGLNGYVFVRFEDDTAGTCRGPNGRGQLQYLGERDARSYVFVGRLNGGTNSPKTLLSALLTARASGSDVKVVIDLRVCQLIQVSL